MNLSLLLESLLKNNVNLLVFSAVGFLFSLIWYVITENRRRAQVQMKENLSDEGAFFGNFEDLENPALKIPDFNLSGAPLAPSSQTTAAIPHSVLPKSILKTSMPPSAEPATIPATGPGSEIADGTSEEESVEAAGETGEQRPDEKKMVVVVAEARSSKSAEDISVPISPTHGGAFSREDFLKNLDQRLAHLLPEIPPVHSDAENNSVPQAKSEENTVGNLSPLPSPTSANESVLKEKPEAQVLQAVQAVKEALDEFDEDELKVKDLLEQIKKDLRDQGESTS